MSSSDIEKGPQHASEPEYGLYSVDSRPQVGQITHLRHHAPLSPFRARFERLVEKYGGESVGVEQLSEEDRDPNQKPRSTWFVWFTANLHYPAITTGALGPLLFGLGWWDSFLTIIFFLFLGTVIPGVISALGPVLGMRSMIITRYSFGWWSSKVIVFLNAVTCIGWIIINTVGAAGLLYDAANGKLPLVASIIIILVISVITSLFGYRAIHFYDRYGWILVAATLTIVVAFGGKHFVNVPMATGTAAPLGVLSYGALVFSWSITWFPLAADYSLYMSSSTPKRETFLWTFSGIYFGSALGFLVGVAFATLISNPDPKYNFPAVYDDRGIGGLVGSVFMEHGNAVRGFGRFIEIVLALSVVGANIPNIYSFGITIQALSSWTQRIPRILVTALGFIIALIISLILRDHFVEALENFINLLSYWVTPYATIVLTEHFIIRPIQHFPYDTALWDKPNLLPPGIAAFIAWAAGLIIAIMGADQTWYEGPIARAIGGADVGFEFAAVAALVVYVPARLVEIRVSGR